MNNICKPLKQRNVKASLTPTIIKILLIFSDFVDRPQAKREKTITANPHTILPLTSLM
jgi:hypothetical protein